MNATILKFGYPDTKIWESEDWILLIRPEQVTFGSCVLASKSNATSLGKLSEAAGARLPKICAALEEFFGSLGSSRTNYLALMMEDPHVHVHVIPRYEKPIVFSEITYLDEAWPGPIDITKNIELLSEGKSQLLAEMRVHFSLVLG